MNNYNMIDSNYQRLVEIYKRTKDDSDLGKLLIYYSNKIKSCDIITDITPISEQINARLNRIYNKSVEINKEIGGLFLQMEDGTLVEQNCIIGEKDSVKNKFNVSDLPKNIKRIITYHTHPNHENFPSSNDIEHLSNLQMIIDVFYEKVIPVVEIIIGRNGLKWYKSNIK